MQRNQLNINLAKQTFGSTNGEYYIILQNIMQPDQWYHYGTPL
jgi:hypothetical protein